MKNMKKEDKVGGIKFIGFMLFLIFLVLIILAILIFFLWIGYKPTIDISKIKRLASNNPLEGILKKYNLIENPTGAVQNISNPIIDNTSINAGNDNPSINPPINNNNPSDNPNSGGSTNNPVENAIKEAELKFNESFIDYMLVNMGIEKLHPIPITGEKPMIEFILESDSYCSVITNSLPSTIKGRCDNEDLRISTTKREAVKALMSDNPKEFLKNSTASGNINIEKVAIDTKLYMKGYLDLYKSLTGQVIRIF